MASTHKHIRSSTANKRPTTAIADGQIALNTNASSPGLFFKDSTGASIIKIGPVHVGSTAPNATPASGGSSGNSTGEIWLDNSLTPVGVKIWNGSAWVNATPVGSTTVQGLLELATDAETQTGSDTARAVTPAGLQSKLSDSTSTTSSTTIASSTAVKSAYDLANAALPKSGGTITGNLEIGTTGSLSFEGSTADAFETTIAVTDPTADRTITLPDTTGTVVTTGDSGTVTSTMIADGTIVDADISASAEIAVSKLADGAARQLLQTDAAGTGVEWASNIDIPGTLDVTSAATFDSTIGASAGTASLPSITFTGAGSTTGIYSPGADQVAVATNGVERVEFGTSEVVFNDGGANYDFRVEGDTNSSLFFVDASAEAVGIGTTSPSNPLHVLSSGGTAKIDSSTNGGSSSLLFDVPASNGIRAIGGNRAKISCEHGASGWDASLVFYSGNNSGNAPTESLRIDSSKRLLIGTSTARRVGDITHTQEIESSNAVTGLSIVRNTNDSGQPIITLGKSRGTTAGAFTVVQNNDFLGTVAFAGADGADLETVAASITAFVDGTPGANDMPGRLVLSTTADGASSPTERLRITSAGLVGIGTTSPSANLHVAAPNNSQLFLQATDTNPTTIILETDAGTSERIRINNKDGALTFDRSNTSESARIDSSGRLLVGTSSSLQVSGVDNAIQVEGTNTVNTHAISAIRHGSTTATAGSVLSLGRSRGTSVGSKTAVANGDTLGIILFAGANGTDFSNAAAWIRSEVDGEPFTAGDTTDLPGRLVFSTTADGASSPTEAMRIRNDGQVLIGATSDAKSGKLEVTGRLAVLNDRESIQTGSATYTASTSATAIIQFDSAAGGFFGAELFVTLCDTASPSGTIVQKVYVAARGSGTNVTAVSVSQSDILRQTGETGTFTGYLTWTAAVVSNRARLSVTATQTSGAATLTVHCNGAPFSFLI